MQRAKSYSLSPSPLALCLSPGTIDRHTTFVVESATNVVGRIRTQREVRAMKNVFLVLMIMFSCVGGFGVFAQPRVSISHYLFRCGSVE